MSAGNSTGASQSDSSGRGSSGFDRALSVTVPRDSAEEVGVILMESLGPFQEIPASGGAEASADAGLDASPDSVTMIFYPQEGPSFPSAADLMALLSPAVLASGAVRIESSEVARDWVDGWKAHFRPLVVGSVRVRPPWEPPPDAVPAGDPDELLDVVINPGLGFGTGLHPTTRGTLKLLQNADERGPLVDVGTGSGVLAVAAGRLGWAPIVAFDNDPVALVSARENVAANGVEDIVELHEAEAGDMTAVWSGGATVLANMTLEPVLALLAGLTAAGAGARPRRLVVSGILAGVQEQQLLRAALLAGFAPGGRVYEAEWVSLELLPEAADATASERS